ncbi:hypothetical protein GA0116948_101447 [Chitinophaga costaii]|uniref:Uncharacterized protein n=1 Tax=Chitinophaga costaii TaxID=1335309 RepID=A0A1C3ZL78_9BACT|nr:hypothetical protein [Chitinophaga costaii]PUZ30420.1 hypothetical protein DCM91_02800 [Chitinophaga costaii]SCB83055.1 hypothetical protein GA0116948_101447 [Chitinophaga costaii]
MLIYSKNGLDNLDIQQDATTAFQLKCISSEEKAAIEKAYPTGFYTPNLFIRISLFFLTTIIVFFVLGFFSLVMLSNGGEQIFNGLMIVSGLCAYGAMELMVQQNKHYRSGVDDALLWSGAGLLLSGLVMAINPSSLQISVMVFIISALATARTADSVMAAVCLLAVLAIIFFGCLHLSHIGSSILPFALMAASLLFYFGVKRAVTLPALHYYRHIAPVLLTLCLLAFYAAGNYYTVSTAHAAIQGQYDDTDSPIALGWLFWLFSTVVPLVYLYFGIKNKDAILIRTSLILVAAAVFTIRYYHHLLPFEWALLLGGLLLVGITYMLIRYLKTPKHGFSDEPEQNASRFGKLQLEALIITQTIHAPAHSEGSHFDYGGGSGGGGGAGGTF